MNVFITGFMLSLSLCLDIGIGNVAIINVTIKHGARHGYWFAFGAIVGDLLYAALSIFGMGLLLQFEVVQWIIWSVGSGLMIWLAYRMALAAWGDAQLESGDLRLPPPARRHLLRDGLLIALASPSSILWFAAVGGSLIAQATNGSALSISQFLTGFFAGGLSWCIFLITMTTQGQKIMGKGFIRGCHVISAMLYVYFAIIVFSDGWKKFGPWTQ